MTIRETVKCDIDTLSDTALVLVRDFVLFQKYRDVFERDDTSYLNAIPGMSDSIRAGMDTPVSDCVPLAKVWPDV
jgi:hypothetical protein